MVGGPTKRHTRGRLGMLVVAHTRHLKPRVVLDTPTGTSPQLVDDYEQQHACRKLLKRKSAMGGNAHSAPLVFVRLSGR